MKKILIAIVGVLGYLLYFGIKEPIFFGEAKKERLGAVTDRLKQVRYAQEFYRDITGKFANSFDSLKYVLETDRKSAKDSLAFLYNDPSRKEKIVLDSLPFVPYGNGARFSIQADTLTYQKTLVNVTEVSTYWKTFMGEYADPSYQRYDNLYFPNNPVKFGDMSGPNLGGNWE